MDFNFSKMRCKKLHYMSESTWRWTIVFTDYMDQLISKYTVIKSRWGTLPIERCIKRLLKLCNRMTNGPN